MEMAIVASVILLVLGVIALRFGLRLVANIGAWCVYGLRDGNVLLWFLFLAMLLGNNIPNRNQLAVQAANVFFAVLAITGFVAIFGRTSLSDRQKARRRLRAHAQEKASLDRANRRMDNLVAVQRIFGVLLGLGR